MNDHTQRAGGNRITVGMFVFVIVAFSATATFGTGIFFGRRDLTQSFAPEPAASRLVDTLIALDLDPELSDEVLKQMTQVILDRAATGDVEAAAFVFQLAARQRAEHTHGDETGRPQDSPRSEGGPR